MISPRRDECHEVSVAISRLGRTEHFRSPRVGRRKYTEYAGFGVFLAAHHNLDQPHQDIR